MLAAAGRRYTSFATILPSSRGFSGVDIADPSIEELGLYLHMSTRRSLLPLYPDILGSRLIGLDILKQCYTYTEKGKRVSRTLQEHLGVGNDHAALIVLGNRVARFWADRSTNTLVLEVTTDNPELSAGVVNAYIARLEEFNSRDRASTAREVCRFVSEKFESCRKELLAAEEKLKLFRDTNRNFDMSTDPRMLMEHRRLERTVELEQVLFFELGKQLRRAGIDAERDIPILNVLDYGCPPGKPSWPKPVQLLITFACAGLGIGVLILVAVESFRRWRTGGNRETVDNLLDEIRRDLRSVPLVRRCVGGRT